MERIVVVEPDSNCRKVTRMFFDGYCANGNEYKASAVPGSKEALDSCGTETYLIISDNNAQGWQELAEKTARYCPGRKFLLLLDPLPQEEEEVIRTAKDYKTKRLIDKYILKPVIKWDSFFPQILKELFRKPYPVREGLGLAEAAP